MSLLRPYIPLTVRIEVAHRQMEKANCLIGMICHCFEQPNKKLILAAMLTWLFGDERQHLDHDPALENREKIIKRGVHVGYIPDANDPDYLIYRTVPEHYVKTHVINGPQFSDTMLANRERKRKRKEKSKNFNWPKGRKIQNRVGGWNGKRDKDRKSDGQSRASKSAYRARPKDHRSAKRKFGRWQ